MKTKIFTLMACLIVVLFSTSVSAQGDPVFTSINTATDEIVITNIGDADIDISSYQLCTNGFRYDSVGSLTSEATLLQPGDDLTLTWNDIPNSGSGTIMLFTTSSFGSSNPNILRDYVSWGGSTFRINQGVTAGRWSDASDSVSLTCPANDAGLIFTDSVRGGNPALWGDADSGVVSLDQTATVNLNVNGTTSIDSETQVTICVDGRPDPIVVNHVTEATLSYLYVITDDSANETILNIVDTNEISLDGAGEGTCSIWGWSYAGFGGLSGALATFQGQPLQDMRDADCSDVSEQSITVVREAADGGNVSIDTNTTDDAQGTTTVTDANNATILVGDGITNPIVVQHVNTSANLSYRYVITDATTGNILNVVNTNTIDLDGVAAGICEIWGWAYRGVPGNGLDQIGQPLSSLDDLDCSDISDNAVTVVRQDANPVEDVLFSTILSGLQENPAALTNASGIVTATLSGNELIVTGSFENLSGDFDANIAGGAHVHRALAGRNGGIEFLLNTTVAADLRSGTYEAANNTFTLTDAQVDALLSRELYINIHTTAFPSGELRGQFLVDSDTVFQSTLLGSNEFPQVNTTAEGSILFELEGDQLTVSGSFDGLSSEIRIDLANGAHIHDNFAGRNGPVVFPLNPTYDADNLGATFEAENNVFTLSTEQLADLNEQGLYINIHSVNNPGGELRGQILPLSSSVFGARLTGNQEVIAADTAANGRIFLSNDGEGNISVGGTFNNLSADLNTALAGGIHVHLATAGRNGGIEFILTPDTSADNRNAIIRPSQNTFTLTDAQVDALFARNLYVNVHSLDFAPGEIRGQLQPLVQSYLGATLSGQNEVQPIITTADGNVQLELSGLHLVVTGAFNNLIGDFDANIAGGSHLHLSDATGNGGIEVLINATTDADLKGGLYTAANNTFTITEAQRDFLLNDEIYLNIHSTEFPSGELRGQILVSENNFPIAGFAITSPDDNAEVSIGGDTAYEVLYDATTDPNGNVVVYTYQLATDDAFSNIVVNEKMGEALTFNNEEAISDALIAEGVAMGGTVTYYQRILASDGSVSAASIVQTVILTLECAANASDIVFSTDNLNDTTSVSDDGLSAVICVDSVADPIGVNMVNPQDSEGANSGWIITDLATGEILGLPTSGPFDLNGAGTGTCQIWYLRYEDGLVGMDVGNLLSDLDGCFDLSNPLDVIREAADGGTVAIDIDATGNPNNTTTFNSDTEAVICVDGNADPLVVTHENPGAENLSYRYVITDAATGLILNVVNSNTISLDGAGQGTCEIWGWSYRGVSGNGLDQIGQPLSSLDDLDCSDISDNAITVIREEADGGTVAIDIEATGNPNNTTTFNSDTEAVICIDGNADPLIVTHENPGAENLSYRYVITDAATGLILNVVNSNTISLDGAGQGTCEIWGWSYRGVSGNGLDQIGQPLSSLDDLDCSDISDNAITVIREEADGGTVQIDIAATDAIGETTTMVLDPMTATIQVGDGIANPIIVVHENDASNLSFRYVVTDNTANQTILGIFNTNAIDLEGAGVGTCLIWGWSYRGLDQDAFIGQPLQALQDEDCSDISDNAITVDRIEDGEPPVVDNVPSDIFTGTGANADDCGAVVTYDEITATDNSGEEVIITLIEGLESGSFFPVGETVVTYLLEDVNGNSATVSFTVTIVDTTTPTVACLDDQVEVGDDEGNYELPDYSSIVNFGDNCADEEGITFEQSPAAGTIISQGEDVDVLLTITDAAGNETTCSFNVLIDENLSVGDETLNNSVTMYPNPAVDVVTVAVSQIVTDLSISVYDITGKEVIRVNGTSSSQQIDVSALSAGIYLLEITNNNNKARAVRRLIKR